MHSLFLTITHCYCVVQKIQCRPTSVRYSPDSLSLFFSKSQHPPGGLGKMKDKNSCVLSKYWTQSKGKQSYMLHIANADVERGEKENKNEKRKLKFVCVCVETFESNQWGVIDCSLMSYVSVT